jgi:transcriptional regulator with XRE-family HTH domain
MHRNFTQQELADRSRVNFGSVKRFEQSGEISLKHLILISKVLRSIEEFDLLFPLDKHVSVEEILKVKELKNEK